MKILYEKKYLLSKKEKEIMDSYLQFLRYNPLPCTKCQARILKKCSGHAICDSLENQNSCEEYGFFLDKAKEYKEKLFNLKDEDFKNIIQEEYNFIIAERDKEKVMAAYLIAKTKREKIVVIPKYSIDYTYNPEDSEIWEKAEFIEEE